MNIHANAGESNSMNIYWSNATNFTPFHRHPFSLHLLPRRIWKTCWEFSILGVWDLLLFVKDNLQGDNFSTAALKQHPRSLEKQTEELQQLPWQPKQITLIWHFHHQPTAISYQVSAISCACQQINQFRSLRVYVCFPAPKWRDPIFISHFPFSTSISFAAVIPRKDLSPRGNDFAVRVDI